VRHMSDLPLSTLLSQVLVAFTIEFDNEFEQRMPHRTATGPAAHSGRGPWLVSMAMWSNFLRHVPATGLPLREVGDLVAMTNLGGLERWGYVVVERDPADERAKPPRGDLVVRPTPAGLRAQRVWQPIAGEVEGLWRQRFGAAAIDRLSTALAAVSGRFEMELPGCLPVVNFGDGMRTTVPAGCGRAVDVDLSVLLSRVLLVWTVDFERESEVSLAIGANVLRVLDETGVLVRALPGRGGVSKEAVAAAVGFLERQGYVVVEPAAGRGKQVVLTAKGRQAQERCREVLESVEQRWKETYGKDEIDELRAALERLVDDSTTLSAGLKPPPDSWRAAIRRPTMLPHHPMVLHRGGFPDGS
jgi:DNA-binding MarR family transcriptional regulator